MRKIIYVRYHRNVECSRHSALVNASFLRPDVSADIFRPKIRCHQDAGLFLAVCFGYQKVELVATPTELAGVHLCFE